MTTAASSETVPESTQNYRHIFEFQILSWNRLMKTRRVVLTRLLVLAIFVAFFSIGVSNPSTDISPNTLLSLLFGATLLTLPISLGVYWVFSRPLVTEERAFFEEQSDRSLYDTSVKYPTEFRITNSDRVIGFRGLWIARVVSVVILFALTTNLLESISSAASQTTSFGPVLVSVLFVPLFLFATYRVLSRPMSNAEIDKFRSGDSSPGMREIECPECATPTDATNLHCPECGSELR
jgi:hypothetical protein